MPSKSQASGKRPALMVVSADVLPEVFTKVLTVKKLLARGEERSSASACKRVGISRSAFYKYRDCVFSYEEKLTQRILTLYITLQDEPGILSNLISVLHEMHANILTVNQNIPVDGVATVTVSIRIDAFGEHEQTAASASQSASEPIDTVRQGTANSHPTSADFQHVISALPGVVECKLISGE